MQQNSPSRPPATPLPSEERTRMGLEIQALVEDATQRIQRHLQTMKSPNKAATKRQLITSTQRVVQESLAPLLVFARDLGDAPQEPNHTADLSFREREVIRLIANGMGNKQIADSLDISIKTVEKHRQNLMDKLGLHSTAELTRFAVATGIVPARFP